MCNLDESVRESTDKLDAAGNTTAAIGKGSAIGSAAMSMIEEIKFQINDMRQKTGQNFARCEGFPNHNKCISISTQASLKKMVAPGCIVILSPLVFGSLFGYRFVSGMLAGCITSGIQIAFSASNTGGAWDNCKKYIEAGLQKRPAG